MGCFFVFQKMNRVLNKLFRNENFLLSCLSRNSLSPKLVLGNKRYLSITEEICRPSPVALSYMVFQPEVQSIPKIPMIILHGLLGSKRNWRGMGKIIAVKSQRKVYALDARNHGDSPHEDDFDCHLMAEDLKYFMNAQSIPEAVIVGHSMGGRTAMYFALTNASYVNKLVVVDVSPVQLPSESSEFLDFMGTMIDVLKSVPKMSIVQATKEIDIILSKTIPDEVVRHFLLTNLTAKNKSLCWKANLEVLLKKFNSGIIKFPSVSENFMKKTLFICGGKSPYIKLEDHPRIKALFPKAEFATIPGAGHWVHTEKPTEFLEILHDFL